MGLHLCFVCRQISVELLAFFAANTKVHLDGYNGRDQVGSAHIGLVPQWYAATVQEVVHWENDIARACLSFFPNLSRAKLYKLDYERLPLPDGAMTWTKTDVDEEDLRQEVKREAMNIFRTERDATHQAVVARAFCLVVVVEFGGFTVDFPHRESITADTLVGSIETLESFADGYRKPRLPRMLQTHSQALKSGALKSS